MCLTIFQKEKKLFYTIKNKKLKSPKIGIFPKGLLHGFGQKFENFPSFLLLAKSASKMCLTIFQKGKKVFLDSKIRKSKKLKNWDFSKGVSLWFRSKIGNFSMFLLFFVKIRQESVFKDILGRKKAFSDCKIRKLKKSKNRDFSNGDSPWFG